jgi:hypothetical protein
VYDTLADLPTKDYRTKKTADIAALPKAPRHRNTPYIPATTIPAITGPVYKLTTAPLMNEEAAKNRALKSRGALFVS